MNFVFILIAMVSLIILIINNPSIIISTLIEGSSASITLCLKLMAIYAVWLSILEIMNRGGLSGVLAKLCKPVTTKIFKGESDLALEYVTLNLATNMLGLGSAATPLGIKAVELMEKGDVATKNTVRFLVMNTTSVQILPATIIALRASHNSTSPADIFLPSLISTIFTTAFALLLVEIFVKDKN